MSDTSRYYKWYPTVSCDLGTMPFEGDWTLSDRIFQMQPGGMWKQYYYGSGASCFGTTVMKKVNGRTKQVWESGVYVSPMEISGISYPVYFNYHGDGVCAAKLPEGQLEPVEE